MTYALLFALGFAGSWAAVRENLAAQAHRTRPVFLFYGLGYAAGAIGCVVWQRREFDALVFFWEGLGGALGAAWAARP